MPNLCQNELFVKGNKKDIKEFKEEAKGTGEDEDTDLSMSNFLPVPEILTRMSAPTFPVESKNLEKEMIKDIENGSDTIPITKKISEALEKKYGADNWYNWQVENWGTKWDIDAHLSTVSNEELVYDFMSAWSPPNNFLVGVSKFYPKLRFYLEYHEGGMGFRGEFEAKNGKTTKDRSWDMTTEELCELGYCDPDECEFCKKDA